MSIVPHDTAMTPAVASAAIFRLAHPDPFRDSRLLMSEEPLQVAVADDVDAVQ